MKRFIILLIALTILFSCGDDSNLFFDRGLAWKKKGQYDKAISNFNKAIELNPKLVMAYNNRGQVWARKGNFDKAISDFTMAIELDPKIVMTYYNRGLAWEKRGKNDKALSDLSKAIEIDPQFAFSYIHRGNIWYNKGEYDKSISDYNEAIKLNPSYASVYNDRGSAWYKNGEYKKSISDFNKTIKLDPNNISAYNNLAWIYATCPFANYRNGKKAVSYAKKIVKYSYSMPVFLNTLAAAYAESGLFKDAVKTQEKAISKLKEGSRYLTQFKQRLELYKQGKPYREKKNKGK